MVRSIYVVNFIDGSSISCRWCLDALTANRVSCAQESALTPPKETGAEGDGDDGPPAAVCEYGVCMVDATTATFSLGQFADDPARSRLRTLLAQQLPVEIVMQKVRLSLRSYGHRVNGLGPTQYRMLSAPQRVWKQARGVTHDMQRVHQLPNRHAPSMILS